MHSPADAGDPAKRIPSLAPSWDPAGRKLSPEEGFLLSRIDGRTPWTQLRDIAGLPPDQVDACLERFVSEGIVVLVEAERESAAPGSGTAPAPAEPEPEPVPVDPDLEIPAEQQQRILAFERGLERPYHALLGIDREADAREIKRAYFALSKEFHPDRYFRRKIGHFSQRLDRIFKRVVEAYELLSDPQTRAEVERSLAEMSPPTPPAAEPASPQAQPAARWTRRDTLERLRRRFRIPEEILAERRLKARQFFESALVAAKRERWSEAAASVRLAIAFDPWNEEYKSGFAEVQVRVHQQRAVELLEQAEASRDGSAFAEALRLYEEVLHYRPADAAVNNSAARVALEVGELEQAHEYAEAACELDPEVAEHHATLGRVMRRAGDRIAAIKAYQRATELDPKHSEAQSALRELRRHGRRTT